MYVERVPMYQYELPCGVSFRTHVKSVADEDEECHWFPCRRCKQVHCIEDAELRFLAPRKVGSIDVAIIKDRIVADIRSGWCEVTDEELAERHEVSVRTVRYVASAMGRNC